MIFCVCVCEFWEHSHVFLHTKITYYCSFSVFSVLNYFHIIQRLQTIQTPKDSENSGHSCFRSDFWYHLKFPKYSRFSGNFGPSISYGQNLQSSENSVLLQLTLILLLLLLLLPQVLHILLQLWILFWINLIITGVLYWTFTLISPSAVQASLWSASSLLCMPAKRSLRRLLVEL